MQTGSLPYFENAFQAVGWFIPPYASMGFLSQLAAEILRPGSNFGEDDLERWLAKLYEPTSLAAMVCSRYPVTPAIDGYQETIAEAIEAHFLGLHHVSVAGLIPVIEGAGRELLLQRNLSATGVRGVFETLAEDCKQEAIARGVGATGEVISMLNSFSWFTRHVFYVDSSTYQFLDGTNRHGITHGAYKDRDYGRPLNLYKVIGAVDFLSLVSAFRASISWLAPSPDEKSLRLAAYYRTLQETRHPAN